MLTGQSDVISLRHRKDRTDQDHLSNSTETQRDDQLIPVQPASPKRPEDVLIFSPIVWSGPPADGILSIWCRLLLL